MNVGSGRSEVQTSMQHQTGSTEGWFSFLLGRGTMLLQGATNTVQGVCCNWFSKVYNQTKRVAEKSGEPVEQPVETNVEIWWTSHELECLMHPFCGYPDRVQHVVGQPQTNARIVQVCLVATFGSLLPFCLAPPRSEGQVLSGLWMCGTSGAFCFYCLSIWVGSPKWMVYFMENPMNKWMISGGKTPIFGSTPI